MKKVLIVLLSVLLALTFISCEKDKSGEVIQNYEDFMSSMNAYYTANNFCMSLIDECGEDAKKEEGKEFGEADKDTIKKSLQQNNSYYVAKLLDVNATEIAIESVDSVSGKLQGTRSDYTASNIVIKFKYTVKEDSSDTRTENEPVEGELKLSVKYSGKGTGDTLTYSISSLSLQDVSYKDVAYSRDRKTGVYTSATVGGVAVELRLLNATN